LDPGAPGPSRTLSLHSLQLASHGDGTVTETGRVRNDGRTGATSVAVARAWYGRHGEVLGVGIASTTPSSLRPGTSGSFAITRPRLGPIQLAATFLRGR